MNRYGGKRGNRQRGRLTQYFRHQRDRNNGLVNKAEKRAEDEYQEWLRGA